MPAYAFETNRGSQKLVEYPSMQHAIDAEFASANARLGDLSVVRCGAAAARRWVKDGGLHETALYVNMDGQVRRATE